MRVLFADDSATMRKVAEITFASDDYELALASSGGEVVAAAKKHSPDVVIIDGDMPGVDGYAACKQLRADPTTSSLPVLMLNGPSQPYDEARAKEAGVTDHMDKPFESQALYNKLEAMASAAASAPPAPPFEAAAKPAAAAKEVPGARPKVGRKTVLGLGAMGFAPKGGPAAADKPAAKPAAGPKPEPRPKPIAQPIPAKPAAKGVPPLPKKTPPPAKPVEKPKPAPQPSAGAPSPLEELSKLGDQSKTVEQRAKELSPEQIEAIRVVAKEVIERVVWEVVPDLAETIIKEELAKLLEK